MTRPAAPRIFGHRGVRREGVDENTLPAFQAALEEGADLIELDVRVARTGEVVVVHDPTLERVTAGADPRAVASLSMAELRAVRLANGASVPTLAEVLDLARARGLGVNVELKHDAHPRADVVRAAARLLGGWDPAHEILVSSFDPWMLAGFAALAPRVPRAILVHPTRYHLLHAALALPLGAKAVHLERTLTRPGLARALRRRGLALHVWTVNDTIEAARLAALGVDGLITDRPGELREALGG